jgi:hypothetical protein
MSTPQPPTDVDSYLRRLTQPDPTAVQRVIAEAFRDANQGAKRPPRWVVTTATLALVVSLVVGTWRWHSSVSSRDSALTITGTDALVVVEDADGRRWAIAPVSSDVERGNYVIVMER